MEELTSSNCPSCGAVVAFTSFYCQNCGKQLRIKPPSTSVLRQIVIYSVSFLLPPSGLWYGFSYLRQNNDKSKAVGLVAIILTLVSVMITVIVIMSIVNATMQVLNGQMVPLNNTNNSELEKMLNNQLNEQLKQYKDVGL